MKELKIKKQEARRKIMHALTEKARKEKKANIAKAFPDSTTVSYAGEGASKNVQGGENIYPTVHHYMDNNTNFTNVSSSDFIGGLNLMKLSLDVKALDAMGTLLEVHRRRRRIKDFSL